MLRRGSTEGIIGYIVTETDEEIYEFLQKDSEMNGVKIYPVINEGPDNELERYDSEDNLTETETYKDKMIRIGG